MTPAHTDHDADLKEAQRIEDAVLTARPAAYLPAHKVAAYARARHGAVLEVFELMVLRGQLCPCRVALIDYPVTEGFLDSCWRCRGRGPTPRFDISGCNITKAVHTSWKSPAKSSQKPLRGRDRMLQPGLRP